MSAERPKILVVDDHPPNLVAMRQVLVGIDAEIVEAGSGNEALALSLEHRFALILLDVLMPGLDGYGVADLLRKEPATRDTPIIFITAAYKDDLHRLGGYEAGGIDYIEKPVDAAVLRSKVKVFLDLFTSRRRLAEANALLERRVEERTRELEIQRALASERERTFRTIFEQAAVGVAMIETTSGRFVRVNRRYADMLGYPVEEMLRRTDHGLTHPDDRENDLVNIGRLVAGAEREFTIEKRYLRSDGTVVWGNLTVAPVFLSNGTFTHHISVVEDISKRKSAEQSLKATLDHHELLVESRTAELRAREDTLKEAQEIAHVGSWAWDIDSGRNTWSDEQFRIFGVSPETTSPSYESFLAALHPDDRDNVVETLREVLEGRKGYDVEYRIIRPDGGQRFIHARGRLYRKSDGTPGRMVGVVQDITGIREAEKALQEKTSLLENVINSSTDYIFIKDLDLRTVLCNASFAKALGKSPEELYGETDIENGWDAELVLGNSEKGIHGFRDDDLRALAGEKVHSNADFGNVWGEVRRFDTVKVPLRTEKGRIFGLLGISRDVTEEKAVEEQLRLSQGRLQAIMDTVPALIASLDEHQRYRFANVHYEKIFGIPPRDMVGKTLREVIGEAAYLRIRPSIERVLAGEAVRFENSVPNKAGGFSVIDGVLTPELDGTGAVRGWFVLAMDITPQRRAESLLTRFGRIVEALDNEIYVFSSETLHFVQANQGARRNSGYSMEELAELTPLDLKPEFTRSSFEEMIRRLREGREEQIAFETVHRRKDGSTYDIAVNLQLVRTESPPVFVAVVRDITAIKRAREELARRTVALERSNAELQQFAYVASHDLQEPLNLIDGYLKLLADQYRGRLSADADEFIGFTLQGVGRMKELIKDLLAFSRVESKGSPFQPVDLGAVFETVAATFRERIAASGGAVTTGPLPTVDGDRTQIAQLLQNLIGNAVKFSRPDRSAAVHLTAVDREADWLFSLSDNGIGIDPRHFEKIFVIFQRLHPRHEYPGTGIGLSICKRVVERHGGHIWVKSTPGQGSTFFFTLPKHPAADGGGGR